MEHIVKKITQLKGPKYKKKRSYENEMKRTIINTRYLYFIFALISGLETAKSQTLQQTSAQRSKQARDSRPEA